MKLQGLFALAMLFLLAGGCTKRTPQVSPPADDPSLSGEGPGERSYTRPTSPNPPDGQGPDGSFLSADGGFSVLFPEKPREKGAASATRTFSVQKDGELFAVELTDLPDDVKKQLAAASLEAKQQVMEAQFDRARDAAIGKGRLLTEQKITLDQYPWLVCEFQYELAENMIGRQRMYLANNRLYAIIASGPKDFVASDDVDKFFASFKLKGQER